MKYISLSEFCEQPGKKAEAARHLGWTPYAVTKALAAERQITLAFDECGSFVDAIEHKVLERKSIEAA